ncbi:MAG: hypothetical protein GX801_10080 [Fibrobacter sp.]|nr:hypothetical protein [Fibrobacter sp.]
MRKYLQLFLLISPLSLFAASALSGGVNGSGTVQSAFPLGKNVLQVDIGGAYYLGEDLRLDEFSKDASRMDIVTAFNYGLFDYFDIGFSVPYYRDYDILDKRHQGVGDLRTSFKMNYPPYPHPAGFEIALLAQFDWPTASSAGKKGGYNRNVWNTTIAGDMQTPQTRNAFGARGPVFVAKMLATANLGAAEDLIPIMLHFNWGAAFSGASSQNAFLIGVGVEITPVPPFTVFWSFESEVPINQASKDIPIFSYPLKSSAGLQFNIDEIGMQVYGGINFDLNPQKDILYTPGIDASSKLPNYQRFPAYGYMIGLSQSFDFSKNAYQSDPQDLEDDSEEVQEELNKAQEAKGAQEEPSKAQEEPNKAQEAKEEPSKQEHPSKEPVEPATSPEAESMGIQPAPKSKSANTELKNPQNQG